VAEDDGAPPRSDRRRRRKPDSDIRHNVVQNDAKERWMPNLRIEHVALNVSDAVAMAAWYVEHLGMRVLRKIDTAPHIHFLADASSAVVMEIYSNPAGEIPAYATMHPLRLHVAFAADDPPAARDALLEAGATFVDEQHLPDGSHLMMLRDPWGLALQLAKRTQPLLPGR
jgi:catechol 2,3-dioxygenase-like lactoylglutathione lyase family enzyme